MGRVAIDVQRPVRRGAPSPPKHRNSSCGPSTAAARVAFRKSSTPGSPVVFRRRIERIHVAQHGDLAALLSELLGFLGHVETKQAHQREHLGSRALPVFGRKREQRKDFDAGVEGALDRFPDGRHAPLVTRGARKAPLLCPPAIAVHDDRDMMRNLALETDFLQ